MCFNFLIKTELVNFTYFNILLASRLTLSVAITICYIRESETRAAMFGFELAKQAEISGPQLTTISNSQKGKNKKQQQ